MLQKKQEYSTLEYNDTSARQLIIKSMQDLKGDRIVELDLQEIEESPADFFIICEGNSTTQVSGIAERIKKDMKEAFNMHPHRAEGMDLSRWILLDYFNILVHIFHPETRAFYQLEDLWGDANTVEFENLG